MEPARNAADSEACDWLTRQDAGSLTAEEQRAFDVWLAADVRHRGAYVRAKVAWSHTQRLAALAPREQQAPTEPARKKRVASWPMLATAAAILVGVIVGPFYIHYFFSRATYRTDVGEVRTVTLSDGSQVTLNADSVVSVRYSNDERAITLGRGEAQFAVAKDPTRPFAVTANRATVTALGTIFTVRLHPDHTNVLVTDGTVEVSSVHEDAINAAARATPIRLTANHQVTLIYGGSAHLESSRVVAVAPATISRELAWREGKAIFAGEPLAVAAAQINRHSRVKIIIDDPELAARPVTGIFRANDAESFASGVAATFGARVEHFGGDIHLAR